MIKKILIRGTLFIATLFLLELFIRLFIPNIPITPVIGILDETQGYKLKADVDSIHKTSEFTTIVYTNSQGYRSPEIDYTKNDNIIRVLFLGDSMTYGWGVNAEERYTNVLADSLGFEMLNAGVPGYKLSNILAYYETEGYKYNPDIVVLAYNLRTGAPNINAGEYEVVNGTLIKKPLYIPTLKNRVKNVIAHFPFYNFLSQHSYLFALVRNSIVVFLNAQAKPITNCTIIEKTWYNSTKEREVLIVQDLNTQVLAQNKTFVLIVLPISYCDFDPLLTDFMNATNLPHQYYLGPAFATNISMYYFPLDGHWNAFGHGIAAQELLPYFQILLSENHERSTYGY